MRLHVVSRMGGGYGTFLKNLRSRGEVVWEVSSSPLPVQPARITHLVLYGYMPDFPFHLFPRSRRLYYFHGLRMLSRRMVLGKTEFNPLHLWRLKRFIRWLGNFHDYISVSFAMREAARGFYGVDSKVVHNGIEVDDYRPCSPSPGDYLVWIGRDAWIKGIDAFLDLMKRLPDKKGIVVGRVEPVEAPDNVSFAGYVDNLRDVICRAGAVVITSYFESFSYVALEALGFGRPVLVLKRAAGAWEILQMLGLYGWGFDTVDDMAEYIGQHPFIPFPERIDLSCFSFDSTYRKLMEVLR